MGPPSFSMKLHQGMLNTHKYYYLIWTVGLMGFVLMGLTSSIISVQNKIALLPLKSKNNIKNRELGF